MHLYLIDLFFNYSCIQHYISFGCTAWRLDSHPTYEVGKTSTHLTPHAVNTIVSTMLPICASHPHDYFLNTFIDYAITVVPFPPFTPLHPAHLLPPTFPPIVHVFGSYILSSLASAFPILFLPSPCLFSTYHLCYLLSVPSPLSPPPTPLLLTLHVISISVVLFLF